MGRAGRSGGSHHLPLPEQARAVHGVALPVVGIELMSGKTREQQLDELLDKQAIYELIMAYRNAADRHDHVKMRTLYHEDAIDDHGHFAKGLAM
jgi:hypothetical protein